jgi:hypothetical protein
LKVINKKICEYNQSVQYLFIDFKIPAELISMCKTCVQKTRSVVRIEGTLSSFFENKTGLKVFIANIIQSSIAKSDTKYTKGS